MGCKNHRMLPIVVGKGCVGESGASATLSHTVPPGGNVSIAVKTVSTNLCPNTGAAALLFRNGILVDAQAITALGASVTTVAAPGDVIVAEVMLFSIPNGIVCIQLGGLCFEMIQN